MGEAEEGTGCSPVGEDVEGEARETVTVTLAGYRFDPAMVEVEAGVVTFDVTNNGSERYEYAGAFELESFAAGGTRTRSGVPP